MELIQQGNLEKILTLSDEFGQIITDINFRFDFERIIGKILESIERLTNFKSLALIELKHDGTSEIIASTLSGNHSNDKTPLLSLPIILKDRHISHTLQIYQVDRNSIPNKDMETLNISLELVVEAVNKRNLQRDPLTKIYNRRFLDDNLQEALTRCKSETAPLSFIMVDVDHFKKFNDNHGHAIGDLVLQTVAQTMDTLCDQINKTLPDQPSRHIWVARYGGEEFSLILPYFDGKKAWQVAESARHTLETLDIKIAEDNSVTITASFGVASYPEHGTSLDVAGLMKLADDALYIAKEKGRNLVQLYDGSAPTVVKHVENPVANGDNGQANGTPLVLSLTTILKRKTFVSAASLSGSSSTGSITTDYARSVIYLLDPHNSNIYALGDKGQLMGKYGSRGDGREQLNMPAGICIDSHSNIWVADMLNHAVKQFSNNGSLMRVLGKVDSSGIPFPAPHTKGGFDRPMVVAVDSRGQVLVAEPFHHRIQRFDAAGSFINQNTVFGDPTDVELQVPKPIAIAVDRDDNYYVLDTHNRMIWVYDQHDGYKSRIGRYGRRSDEFDDLVGMTIMPPNRFAMKLAELGIIPPEYEEAELLLTIEAGDTNRLKVLSLDGKVLTNADLRFRAAGITTDWDGRLYMIDHTNNSIERFEVVV